MCKAEVQKIRTISTHESYHGWPSITRRSNGELLVVASAGRVCHVGPFGQVHLLRSSDDGETWSNESVVNTPLDDRDAGVVETSKGTILIDWFNSIGAIKRMRDTREEGYGKIFDLCDSGLNITGNMMQSLFEKLDVLLDDDTIKRELGPWLIRSEDGGNTWSEKIDCKVGTPHGPTELNDGRLLYVGNLKYKAENAGFKGSPYDPELGVAESKDDGKTWEVISTIPLRDSDSVEDYHEPHIVEAADGRLIVHIRHHGETDKHMILQCESEDGGKSWSQPHSLGVYGFPPHLLRLKDGRLLCSYSYRADPYGNRAIVSSDNGKTWSEPMVLTSKEFTSDIGYPATIEMPDGSLITVWYEYMHHLQRAVLRTARWTLKS